MPSVAFERGPHPLGVDVASGAGRDIRDHLEGRYQTNLFKFRKLFKDVIAKERNDTGLSQTTPNGGQRHGWTAD